jgi:hypothetical protein
MSNTRNEGKIRLVRHSDAFWRVTFDLPPLDIFGPANIPQLEEFVSSLESDDRVKVVTYRRIKRSWTEQAYPMIETCPLERAGEAYARMMRGKAQFRVVLTM